VFSIAYLLLAAVAMPATIPEPVTPTPYVATYAVSYRGMNVGLIHFELIAEEDGRFIFESYAEPSRLARVVVGGPAAERSIMLIDAAGVRPLSWFMQDGNLRFVWEEGRVAGVVEGKPIELPTEAGLQDRLSIQIAVMTALLNEREPGTIPMINDDSIKYYSYNRTGSGPISTQAGEFEAIVYESTRAGSSRTSLLWHAPALGYIPVRAEQLRNGQVETVMELVRVRRI
jgi:hypothetical protein